MKSTPKSSLSQRGDTLVEVLVCMAIVCSVLGGVFAIANANKLAVTNSHEHDNAVKILESQLEEMRAYGNNNPVRGRGVFVSGAFCMYQGSPVLTSTGDCVQNANGNIATQQPKYTVSIQCQSGCPNANGGYLYNASIRWSQVTGHGNGTESMYYRLYP